MTEPDHHRNVLPHEELSRVMPVEDPGTDMVSRTRRAVSLGLAVQWTANVPDEVSVDRVVEIAEQFTRYIAVGEKPHQKKEKDMGGMGIGPQRTDFSKALVSLRTGEKITRDAWGFHGVFVVYQKGYPGGIGINANTAEATGIPEGTRIVFKPYLMMRNGNGQFVPWTPSQEDVLALDWYVSEWTAGNP